MDPYWQVQEKTDPILAGSWQDKSNISTCRTSWISYCKLQNKLDPIVLLEEETGLLLGTFLLSLINLNPLECIFKKCWSTYVKRMDPCWECSSIWKSICTGCDWPLWGHTERLQVLSAEVGTLLRRGKYWKGGPRGNLRGAHGPSGAEQAGRLRQRAASLG
jgi:hypothetical protein